MEKYAGVSARPSRTVYAIFLISWAAAVAVGIALRWWLSRRGLMLDEAWVANSVLSPGLDGMFFYREWLQTTPPLFLLWLRWTVAEFGVSRFTLELPAILAALVSLVLIARMARRFADRVDRPLVAALSAALLLLSPVAAFYETACKQYSGEVLATLVLLAAVARGTGRAAPVAAGWLAAGGIFSLLSSHGTVFLLPGAGLWLLAHPGPDSWRRRFLWLSPVLAVLLGVFAFEYLYYIRPNTNEELRHFWQAVPVGTPREAWAHWVEYMLRAVSYFVSLQGPWSFRIGEGIVALAGGIYAAGTWRLAATRAGRWWMAESFLLWELPVLLVIAADALSVFPFSQRTALFLLPGMILALVLRFAAIWRSPARRWSAAAAAVLAVAACSASDIHPVRMEQEEEAYLELQHLAGKGEVVFVHRSMQQQVRIEEKLHGPLAARVVMGATGPGCCSRGPEPPPEEPALVVADVATKLGDRPRRVWFYHTDREGLWRYLGLNEADVVNHYLTAKGYQPIYRSALTEVSIEGYEYRPAALTASVRWGRGAAGGRRQAR